MNKHTPLGQGGALDEVRAQLQAVSHELQRVGMPEIPLSGQLLRPLLAYSTFQQFRDVDARRYWHGVAAVQLAHEASLVHDDIIDSAALRRGEPALHARAGIPFALAQGDHLLTAAYRAAAGTRSRSVMTLFARSVERTVKGELQQAAHLGKVVDSAEYFRTVSLKSGELIGYAMAIAPALARSPHANAFFRMGSAIGVLYQMLDDLLDYCPHASTGKPTLGDYRQGRWTWPMLFMPYVSFGADPNAVAEHFFTPRDGVSPAHQCLKHLVASARAIEHTAEALMTDTSILRALLSDWLDRAHAEVLAHTMVSVETQRAQLMSMLADSTDIGNYFSKNSRSFSFAARLFSEEERALVSLVYAFCRFTDDLVDGASASDLSQTRGLLELWRKEARSAYEGRQTGMFILDQLMPETARRGVPFKYADELINGVAMDLSDVRYTDMQELRKYTYRVASVVGQWLTELFGVRDPEVLEHAAALGHAMQITNIVRDVGEDFKVGRVYLPADMLNRHDVDIAAIAESGVVTAPYRALMEEMMEEADRHYAKSLKAVGALPRGMRMAVLAAAAIYRGIHQEIRRNNYDNLNRRARTSAGRKAWLALKAVAPTVAS